MAKRLHHDLWSQIGLGPNSGLVTLELCHHWINLPDYLLLQIPTLHSGHKY